MKKTDLSLYNNSWYSPKAGPIKRTLWLWINSLIIKSNIVFFSGIKTFFLKLFGAKIGKNVTIKPGVSVKYPWLLTIGDHVWIGEDVWIDNLTETKIGNHVCLSQGAMLLTGNHNFKKETFDLIIGGITLEDGVWIGAQSTVCPGITCKSHSVLAVNSVATKNLDAYGIYQGNPAQKVRDRIIS